MAILPYQNKILDGITIEFKDSVIESALGDNYTQVVKIGLPYFISSLTIAPLSQVELDTLVQFLDVNIESSLDCSVFVEGMTHKVYVEPETLKLSPVTYGKFSVSFNVTEDRL